MLISNSIETEEGVVKFNGEISGVELDYVIQTGLLTLMRNGVIKATVQEKEKAVAQGDLH